MHPFKRHIVANRNIAKVLTVVLGLSLLMSCAGPTNPWGHYGANLPSQGSRVASTSGQSQNKPVVVRTISSLSVEEDVSMTFFPRRQNFHQTAEFSVKVRDTKVIPANADLRLYYNGTDVTSSWLKNAQISYNEDHRVMTLQFHGVKLLAQKDHNIAVSYTRDKQSQPVVKKYLAPSCSLADLEPLGDLGPFQSEQHIYRHLIEGISGSEGVNPSLVAGLIAQESAFNPLAVSYAKAIGLTQVTRGAATHVLESYDNYPTYPSLHTYPVPLIKTMILSGEVNAENEWRLDPRSSIKGGITYLKFVENYWLAEHSHQLILRNYPVSKLENNSDIIENVLDDLILASYNSGPFRVKKALKKRGQDWLNSPHLQEAKKYVRKVKSYCYHFAANNNVRPRFPQENN